MLEVRNNEFSRAGGFSQQINHAPLKFGTARFYVLATVRIATDIASLLTIRLPLGVNSAGGKH